jgi:hypothetical protein
MLETQREKERGEGKSEGRGDRERSCIGSVMN